MRRIISCLFAAGAVFIASCSASHGIPEPLPDVPRDTRFGDLTEDQFREWCQWREDIAGGDTIVCADGRESYHYDAEQCAETRVFYTRSDCTLKLGDATECVAHMIETCRSGALERSPTCDPPDRGTCG